MISSIYLWYYLSTKYFNGGDILLSMFKAAFTLFAVIICIAALIITVRFIHDFLITFLK